MSPAAFITRNCSRCARLVAVTVSERIERDEIVWTASRSCTHCGYAPPSVERREWPPAEVRDALERMSRVRIRLEPSKIPRAMALRRIAPMFERNEWSDRDRVVDELLSGEYTATPIEGEWMRSLFPSPMRLVIEQTDPLPPVADFSAEDLRSLEPRWTTERDRWVLERVGDGFLPINVFRRILEVIEDNELSARLIANMAEAGVPIVDRGYVRPRSVPEESLPVSVSANELSAFLYRLQDGRFQVVRDGAFPVLLCGPDHILVRRALRDALRELGATGWTAVPVALYEPSTKEEMQIYDELVIDREIAPETIEDETRLHERGVWQFDRHVLFVARTIGEALKVRFPELDTSVGFSEFG